MSTDATTPVVLGHAAIDAGAAATPPLAVPVELQPYDPGLRTVGAIERALRAAAGPGGWERVGRSLGTVLRGTPTPAEQSVARAGDALRAVLAPGQIAPAMPPWVAVGSALGELAEGALQEVESAFVDDPRIAFSTGFVEGCAEGVVTALEEQVTSIKTLLGHVVDFYSLVYDVNVLSELFEIWFTQRSATAMDELASYLREFYPQLSQALVNAGPLLAGLDRIAGQLRDQRTDASGLSIAWQAAGEWMARIPEALGATLRPQLEAIVAAQGNPREQGAIIGRVAGPAIIQIVIAALGLANLAKGALTFFAERGPLLVAQVRDLTQEALDGILRLTRLQFDAEELLAASAQAEKVSAGVGSAAGSVVDGFFKQLIAEWGELGYRIGPYSVNSRETGAWNRAVRAFSGLTTKDAEYAISVRLDSNHIIEDQWFEPFSAEFRKVFKDWPVLDSRGNPVMVKGVPLKVSWRSAKDMDAIAIHTEAHIRSGTQMAKQGLLGADGRPPLSPEMDAFFARYRQAQLGGRPFASLREVVEAHKRFYQEERTSTLWPRVSAWFSRVDAAMAAAGVP